MTYKFVSVKTGSGRCGSKRKNSLLVPNVANDHRRTDGVRVSKPLRTSFTNRRTSEVKILNKDKKSLEDSELSEAKENSIPTAGNGFIKELSDDMVKSILPKLIEDAAEGVSFDSEAVDAIKKACAEYVAKRFHEIDVCQVKIIKPDSGISSATTKTESH